MELEDFSQLDSAQAASGLFEAVSDVLEHFAFMFTDPLESSDFRPATSNLMQAQIVFDGPFRGALSMFSSLTFCLRLAADVLGVEPEEISSDYAGDALKELVNVTCAEVLLRLAGREVLFDFSIPKVRRLPTEKAMQALQEPGAISVLVDELPMIVRIEIES